MGALLLASSSPLTLTHLVSCFETLATVQGQVYSWLMIACMMVSTGFQQGLALEHLKHARTPLNQLCNQCFASAMPGRWRLQAAAAGSSEHSGLVLERNGIVSGNWQASVGF
jgi:hypothetical protein